MFAVFGMTRAYAQKKALLNVQAVKNGKALTQDQYQRNFDVYVTEMLEGGKVAKISPEFSTPEVANHWLELAKKYDGCRMEVCIHHPHKEMLRKGIKTIQHKWSFFVKGKDYQLVKYLG